MFSDRPQSYLFTIVSLTSSNQELIGALLKLLPFVLILILLISLLVAWICSRIIVKPVTEISEVSRRMAKLDMTWECRINRTDEIGILAHSLNTMSKNLSESMHELEAANEQLKQDMERIDELNKQHQYFFATASHELKTPITIIKGQVESMILGIGRYKDTRGGTSGNIKRNRTYGATGKRNPCYLKTRNESYSSHGASFALRIFEVCVPMSCSPCKR